MIAVLATSLLSLSPAPAGLDPAAAGADAVDSAVGGPPVGAVDLRRTRSGPSPASRDVAAVGAGSALLGVGALLLLRRREN